MPINDRTIALGAGIAVVAAVVLGVLAWRLRRAAGGSKRGSVSSGNLASSLHDEQLRSSIILNTIEDGVVLIDSQQVIRLFNPGASHMTGWSVEDATGLSWPAVFKFVNSKGEPISTADDPVLKLFSTKDAVRNSAANLLTKSEKTITVSLVLSPILDEQKQVTGGVAVFRDVSEELKAEQQRAEFISTASHEMRTPVAAIEGYLALALNDKVSTIDSRARDYLEKAHASTQHLGKLFQDLLTSAKAEDGRLTSHPEVVEIGAFLEQLTGDLKFAAEKKGLGVDFTLGATRTIDASAGNSGNKVIRPLYYAYADPERLREVITNLFDNAVKYTDEGKVTIGLTGNDQVVQFFVRDTGFGIPAEDIPHMFQKFYRVDNSATRTIGGTGLGLFISRKIIELYGGRIWVESELGKGSTFYINLPRLSTQRAEELKGRGETTILRPTTSLTQTP
ncbi:MAG TPA: ATP-binding protein [Candidatus Saccharimonadales bacterium]|nr:ATP-binding protein [Candidatus Saccharimonadales bacterium]